MPTCKRRARAAAALLLAGWLSLVGGVGAAHAAGSEAAPTDDELVAIYERAIQSGVLTDADRARLLLRDDAASLIDPVNIEVAPEEVAPEEVTPIAAQGIVVLAAVKCVTKDRYVIYKSLTRQKLVDYHFVVSWCFNGSRITKTPQRSHYIVSYSPGIEDKGFTANTLTWTRTNHFSAAITLQGKVAQCAGDLCLPGAQPLTKWGVYGNGDYVYSVNP